MAIFLEKFQVAPPPATAQELWLPLSFLDIIWLPFHPIRRLLFYELTSPKEHVIATVISDLRNSLSLALKYYPSLAGKILYPSNSEAKPVLSYLPERDSVTFSVFESDKDFDYLVGNFQRDSDLLYDLIPEMPPAMEESDCKLLHLLTIQVTIFQGRAICIGVANHHSVGDATSIVGFLKFWASICKIGEDEKLPIKPIFDKPLLKKSDDLSSIFLNQVRQIPPEFGEIHFPTRRVRATYNFSPSNIKKLKDSALERNPSFLHLSSFVVTAACIWTCLAKSLSQESGEEISDEEPEFFVFAVDCRSRLDPPLPENYFGNYVAYGIAKLPHIELIGDEGFPKAAEAIAADIRNRINIKGELLKGCENWLMELSQISQQRCLSVAGSAKVDLYGLDFGWGGPVKFESPSIDQDQYAFSLCRAPDGGLEVGLSLPPEKMAVFHANFQGGREH